MASIFTRIINGEIPGYKVAENDDFIAFLDIRPLQKGHTLVVPKLEVDYIFDHEDELLQDLIVFSKKVAKAIESVVPTNRIGLSVIGLEVPHTHVHLIPISAIGDMNFSAVRPNFSESEMEETAQKIASAFQAQNFAPDIDPYKDYLALLLIYTANTSDGLSDEESTHIKKQVGESHFDTAKEIFDNNSEVEVIEKIDELSKVCALGQNKERVFADLKEIIEVDHVEYALQQNILRMLKRLI